MRNGNEPVDETALTARPQDPQDPQDETEVTDPGEAEPVVVTEEDAIPSIDDVWGTPPRATYRDWDPAETRVVTYTTNPEAYPRDAVATSYAEARHLAEAVYGRILETNSVPHRFFFRVYKVRPAREVTL